MNVCDRRFGSRNQIQLTELSGVVALSDAVVLILELGKLSDTHQTVFANHEWWRNLHITVVVRVEVEHVLDQRAFELRAPIRVQNESTPRELGAPSEIHQCQTFAQFNVSPRL